MNRNQSGDEQHLNKMTCHDSTLMENRCTENAIADHLFAILTNNKILDGEREIDAISIVFLVQNRPCSSKNRSKVGDVAKAMSASQIQSFFFVKRAMERLKCDIKSFPSKWWQREVFFASERKRHSAITANVHCCDASRPYFICQQWWPTVHVSRCSGAHVRRAEYFNFFSDIFCFSASQKCPLWWQRQLPCAVTA